MWLRRIRTVLSERSQREQRLLLAASAGLGCWLVVRCWFIPLGHYLEAQQVLSGTALNALSRMTVYAREQHFIARQDTTRDRASLMKALRDSGITPSKTDIVDGRATLALPDMPVEALFGFITALELKHGFRVIYFSMNVHGDQGVVNVPVLKLELNR